MLSGRRLMLSIMLLFLASMHQWLAIATLARDNSLPMNDG
jgi:hypothetical protein